MFLAVSFIGTAMLRFHHQRSIRLIYPNATLIKNDKLKECNIFNKYKKHPPKYASLRGMEGLIIVTRFGALLREA